MSTRGATPLFVDTGTFYARADDDDEHHETARAVFDGIRGITVSSPHTSQAVLSELATLVLCTLGHDVAVRTLTTIRDSESFTVLPVERHDFTAGP